MKALSLLMAIAIMGITGFQAYWLKENYEREKRTLDIKTSAIFRESVLRLQGSKLKLDGFEWGDSVHKGNVKIFVSNGRDEQVSAKFEPRQEIVSTINVIRDKLKDSVQRTMTTGMIISTTGDSLHLNRHIHAGTGKDNIFNMLIGVDSLQDSLKVSEIDSVCRKAFGEEKLGIPFSVQRLDSAVLADGPVPNEVTIGFSKPVTYRFKTGNMVSYLLKRISMPILFSFILLGITILSFVLLYRSLLKQRRLSELKNEFINNITHELKTPIATVGVAIEALRNFNAINDPQKTKEYLDISQNELHRLSLLVDKVLKLSMFENRQLDLKFEPVNLKEIVDEVTASMKLQMEKFHAAINVNCEGDMSLKGDRMHLTSVVFNLLDNALKYSKTNPSIRVELKGDENNVTIIVSDNGIGIAPEYKNKVFEKFFRVPHGDTHNAKGYGLGLSYVLQVIQKHNGTIKVETEPGAGSTFIITLPKQNT